MYANYVDIFSNFVIYLCVLLVAYAFFRPRKHYGHLPPGPTPFPLVGNILQLAGQDLHEKLKEYRKTYGNIFCLRIFNTVLIVVSGYDAIRDILVKHGDVSSERPSTGLPPFKGDGIVFANGEIWKHNRRFAIQTLRDFGMGKNKLQCRVHEEISYFLEAIENTNGQPFDIKHLVNVSVSNIISSMVFGKRFDYNDKEFLGYVHCMDEIVKLSSFMKPDWAEYIPFDPFHVTESRRCLRKLIEFYKVKIKEHINDFDEDNVRDLIDVYVKQMKENDTSGKPSMVNEEELTRIVHDLFVTGTETTTTVIRSGLVYLLRNQEVQTRLSQELQKAVSDHRLSDVNDKKNLPFMEATISEILRRGCIAPFGAPHSPKVDLEYGGYKIPKSAIIMTNLETVLLDEKLWEEPLNFNPSRFLDENSLVKTMEGFIPFSCGPRVCLGESMAKMEIYLFLSAMLQSFKFLPAEGEDPAAMEFVRGGITCAPKPFKLRALKILRSSEMQR